MILRHGDSNLISGFSAGKPGNEVAVPVFPRRICGCGRRESMADTLEIKKRFERNAKAVKLRPSLGKYTSVSKVRLREGLTCDVEEGSWKLVADMGKDSGGEEEGPSPGVYGRAALGSCLAIATAQWAAKLGVPLDGIEVDVESDADAAGAYGVADVPPGYTQVRCRVTVKSSAPEEEVRNLIDVATDRCLFWDVFARAVDLRREVRIVAPEE
jgi:uncharacterized OsmC-like protein